MGVFFHALKFLGGDDMKWIDAGDIPAAELNEKDKRLTIQMTTKPNFDHSENKRDKNELCATNKRSHSTRKHVRLSGENKRTQPCLVSNGDLHRSENIRHIKNEGQRCEKQKGHNPRRKENRQEKDDTD